MENETILLICDSPELIALCEENIKSVKDHKVKLVIAGISADKQLLLTLGDNVSCVLLTQDTGSQAWLENLKLTEWPVVYLCDSAPDAAVIHGNCIDHILISELKAGMADRVIAHVLEKTELHKKISAQAVTLDRLVYHDPISELPNRLLFEVTLAKILARAKRYNRRMAVLFLDIDVFKTFNDSLGHFAGNQLLKQIAVRIKSVTRKNDFLARLGSDEYGVILDEIDLFYGAGAFAERLEEALRPPFVINTEHVFVTASIGISTYPEAGDTVDDLMKNADIAMSRVKEIGGNGYQFYASEMNDKLIHFLETKNALYNALINKNFCLHYQPKFNIHTQAIVGLEALIRWERNGTELVYPDKFIPIAEKLGLIVPIGYWVIETVCQQIKEWQEKGIFLPIAINVSAKQFNERNFLKELRALLRKYHVEERFIEIELTESALMANPIISKKTMIDLQKMGITLSIDDFGTGYSSLSYIKHLPVSMLKIDRAFIKDIQNDLHDQAIVKSIIALCETLNIYTVAEGIETKEQLIELQKLHCDFGQGYYFSRPHDTKVITQFILENMKK